MWIKICGVTRESDAFQIAECGADAIGLNFYSGSRRCISVAQGRLIRQQVGTSLSVVGVFVNSDVGQVVDIVNSVGLSMVQFHGDESASLIADFHQRCPEIGIIRACRIGSGENSELPSQLSELQSLSVPLQAVLVDAFVAGEYGGTGRQIDIALLPHSAEIGVPLILAGGLKPENVAAAIKSVKPWGIDTAGGVEQSPGVKCSERVAAFIRAARGASA
ncbi:MAG: phosphoribosylanthranilate isomerase [Planctomycetaceae bacterium]